MSDPAGQMPGTAGGSQVPRSGHCACVRLRLPAQPRSGRTAAAGPDAPATRMNSQRGGPAGSSGAGGHAGPGGMAQLGGTITERWVLAQQTALSIEREPPFGAVELLRVLVGPGTQIRLI